MSVESVTYIGDLNPASPAGGEPKSQGDDHVRNLKAASKNSFPGFPGAILCTGTDGGAVNAYTVTPATPLPSYSAKTELLFSPTVTNTGAVTLNVSGLGAKTLLSVDGGALASGDLVAGRYYRAVYDGAAFRLLAITKNYIDQLVISGAVPGVTSPANAGKFFTTDGTGGFWQQIDGRGSPYIDLGDSGTTSQVLTYSASAEGWKLRATGSFTLSASGWPSGRLCGGLLQLTNGGAFTLTTSNITWIKSDGTQTATFSSSGIALQASGTNLIALFSYGDGTVYGKAL